MEWHEKKFGWLWKNVGGHFPCLFHDLYVKVLQAKKKIVEQFLHQLYVSMLKCPPAKQTLFLTVNILTIFAKKSV